MQDAHRSVGTSMTPHAIHILAVDDEPALCELTKSFLESSEAMEVDIACSVAEARTALGQKHYDVIVSDYQMPIEDGIRFLKSLRGKGDHIPFILFTGKGREDVVIEALNHGADSYLQKGGAPQAQFAELEHMIRTAVERRRAEHALIRLNECLVSLESDFSENLRRITSTGGELLNASFALYSQISNEELLQVASGKTRKGQQVRSSIKDSLCYEVVRRGANSLILEGLQQSPLAETVPSIRRLGISTFLSHVVRHQGRPLGMLCVGYTYPAKIAGMEQRLLGILAKAIEAEEERRLATQRIERSESKYRGFFENIRTPMAIYRYVLDENGEVIHWILEDTNASGLELMGRSSIEEVRGKNELELFSAQDREVRLPLINEVKANRGPIVQETHFAWNKRTYISLIYCFDDEHFVNAVTDITDRVHMENALKESSAKYQTLLRTLPVGVTISDKNGNIIDSNEMAERLLGLSMEEQKRRKIAGEEWSVVRPDCTPMPPAEFASVRALKEGRTVANVEMGLKHDEKVTWINVTAAPVPIEDFGVTITYSDISERKQMEDALRESEKRYRLIFENMLNGMAYCKMLFDEEGRPEDFIYLEVNRKFELLTRLKDVVGRKVTEIIPDVKESSPELFEAYGRVASTGKPERFETYLQSLDSWLDISVYSPQRGLFIAIFDNITERKRAELAVRESEERSLLLIENIRDPFMITDFNGSIHYANQALSLLLGVMPDTDPDELDLMGNMHPSSMERLLSDLQQIKDTDGPLNVEYELANGSQGKKNVEGIGRRVHWDGNRRCLLILRDVTRAKRTERLLEAHLRLSECSQNTSLDELLQKALDEAEDLTDSTIGFLHFVDDDQEKLQLQMWSTNTIKRMCTAEGKGQHYRISMAGVWVDCVRARRPVIHNDIAGLLHRKGFPAGHAAVRRELVVPVMRNGKVKAILGVGNKETDYDDADVDIVRDLADLVWDITERKRIEDELRKLARAAENSPACIVITDLNGSIEWINPKFTSLTGYTLEEAKGQNPRILKSGETPKEEYQRMYQILLGGGTWHGEFHNKKKNGELYWESVSIAPIFDDAGKIAHFIASKEDITERKRVEEALREREETNRIHIENSFDVIFTLDSNGSFVFLSPAWERHFGHPIADALGKSFSLFIHPDDIAPLTGFLSHILSTRQSETSPAYRVKHAKGTWLWFIANCSTYVDTEGELRLIGVGHDITELKAAEEAQRQNEETLRLVVDAAPFPLMITDVDGTYILDANERATTYFGLELAQGQTLRDLFMRESELQKMMETAVDQGFVDDMEVTIQVKGRDSRHAMVSMRSMHHLGDERWIIATYDITERYAMEKALQQASEKLSMLNSITRHDVVNQMLALSGYIELCKHKEKDATLLTYLDKMARATDNVQKQINFTKEYQDVGVRAPAWASPGRQTADAFAMLHPAGMDLEDDTKGVEVLADPLAEKVPYNLIDNSMRHGEHVSYIKLSAEQRGDAVLLVYEDNGVGISAEDKKRLFEKGFGKNTGFGLFLTREILAITGITITETGKAGEGVRFEMMV
ncbi:MAG: PAS domain S-box protein, partial [Methanomassiliicoccales archaeon]